MPRERSVVRRIPSPPDRGFDRNMPRGEAVETMRFVDCSATIRLGLFVAVPVLPIVLIHQVPVGSALIALTVSVAAVANRSRVIYRRIRRN